MDLNKTFAGTALAVDTEPLALLRGHLQAAQELLSGSGSPGLSDKVGPLAPVLAMVIGEVIKALDQSGASTEAPLTLAGLSLSRTSLTGLISGLEQAVEQSAAARREAEQKLEECGTAPELLQAREGLTLLWECVRAYAARIAERERGGGAAEEAAGDLGAVPEAWNAGRGQPAATAKELLRRFSEIEGRYPQLRRPGGEG